MSAKKAYLGDGAYVAIEPGMGIVITAENGLRATDTVYLDDSGITALVRWLAANGFTTPADTPPPRQ